MECLERLRKFLEDRNVPYIHTEHPLAYTAREVASAERLTPREVAKTVIVWGDNGYQMVVLPADEAIDFQELRAALGLSHARLATEKEIGRLFGDCELGAMPPFGNFFGIPVYVDSNLARDERIAFNAGTHRDVIHISFEDYKKLVDPIIVPVAREVTMRHGW